MTTASELGTWFDAAPEGSTHMIVACDSFDHEDYPVYVSSDKNVREEEKRVNTSSMQRVMEVYNLAMDKKAQLAQHRAFNY